MKDHLDVLQCPDCGSKDIRYVENGPHIEARCGNCGKSHIKYVMQVTSREKWAACVKARDGLVCCICGKELTKRTAHSHHLIPVNIAPQFEFALDNGIVVCVDCHHRIHGAPGTIV